MSHWKLFPHLVVRTTGFPFDLLEQLRSDQAAPLARRLASERAALETFKAEGPRLRRPSRGMLAALKAGRPIDVSGMESPESFAEYNRHAQAAIDAEGAYEGAFAQDALRIRDQMARLSADPRFLEAVASSSPPVFQDLIRGRSGARLDRQVASYLQRLCGKNETMSFFGPINYGLAEPQEAEGVRLSWSGPEFLAGRHTFAGSWVVAGIMRAVAFDPEIAPWLVLRRKAFEKTPSRKGSDVSAEVLLPRLTEAVEGTLPLLHLARKLEVPIEKLVEAAQLGCERGLLTHQLEVPAASHRPLADLAERLAGFPGEQARKHLKELNGILLAMGGYGRSTAAEKVALNEKTGQQVRDFWRLGMPVPAAAGSPASPERRGESHNFYQDRLPLREECGGDLKLEVGGARAQELSSRLSRVLGLMGEAALRTRDAARSSVAALIGARTVPFWKVVAAFSDRPVPYDHSVSQAVAALIPDASVSQVDLSAADLPSVRTHTQLPIITSVDLLVGAKDVEAWSRGDYELVLGDVHDTALVWGWALQFHEARADVESEMVRFLGTLPRPVPFVTVLASRRTGLLPAEFPGPVVELGSVSARASAWRLPFDDLQVESDGKQARLLSVRLGSEVCLYNGELESLVHTAFALPRVRPLRIRMGAHTPRVVLDGVVAQREQWHLDAEGRGALLACKDDKSRLKVALALWARLGLPDYVFAKFQDERKPILVDVQSPPLLKVFVNLLEQRGEVFLSEMKPAPDQLWLEGPLGRHTAELRCTLAWGGEGPVEPPQGADR